MDIKIIKKLGAGVIGTVYLVESSGKRYIYKIEKYKPETKQIPLMHSYDRQIDFDRKIAQHYPDKFLTLKSYGILEKCDHKQPVPDWVKGTFRKELIDKNKQSVCYFLIYSPVLKHTIRDLSKKINGNDKSYFKMMYQLIEQVNIIRMAGFRHGDIHSGNVMSDGKNFRLIDYGNISHKKYPINKEDRNLNKYLVPSDIVMVLWNLAIESPIAEYAIKNKIQFPKFETFAKRMDGYPETGELIKTLPAGLNKADHRELLAFLMAINNYQIYKECLGFGNKKYDKYMMTLTPKRHDLLTYCVRHAADKDYSSILRYMKKLNI